MTRNGGRCVFFGARTHLPRFVLFSSHATFVARGWKPPVKGGRAVDWVTGEGTLRPDCGCRAHYILFFFFFFFMLMLRFDRSPNSRLSRVPRGFCVCRSPLSTPPPIPSPVTMSDEKPDTKHINIKVQDQNGTEVFFKVGLIDRSGCCLFALVFCAGCCGWSFVAGL